MMETSENETPPPRADPVVETILAVLAELAPGESASPMDVARAFAAARAKPSDPTDVWRRCMNAVDRKSLV